MAIEGGCYCTAVRYRISGEPLFRGECYCRECQYYAGGGADRILAVAEIELTGPSGDLLSYRNPDRPDGVTRVFCANCATPILHRDPRLPGIVIIKVGSLDDPSVFGAPDAVTHTGDCQNYHILPEGVRTFQKRPG
jgi:hypothetical protein